MKDKLDPESIEFIAFAMEYLEDPEVRQEFFLECRRRFQNFIARDPEYIKSVLEVKLIKGGEEHGSPIYPPHEVDQELEHEYTDILGWSLVRLWNEKRNA